MTSNLPSFGVIMPTAGERPTLARAAWSALSQLGPLDKFFLVQDGDRAIQSTDLFVQELREGNAEQFDRQFCVIPLGGPAADDFGGTPRNVALGRLAHEGVTHVLFIDDDDILVPGVLDHARRIVAKNPDRLHLWRFVTTYRIALWMTEVVAQGNIGTASIITPNDGVVGRWTHRYEGDFDFIVDTLNQRHQEPIWVPLFLQVARPTPGDANDLADLNQRLGGSL